MNSIDSEYAKEVPDVDIVIPVYKPDKNFPELISRLQKQRYAVRHIILMHTTDGVDLSWIHKYENVTEHMIVPEEFDHGGTRNQGIQLSHADVVICMTQDAMPSDCDLVGNLVNALQDREIVVAYARQLPNASCDLLERYTRRFNYPNESRIKSKEDITTLGIKTFFCSNVCAAYNRVIYNNQQGFEKKTIFNEDMIYAAKVIMSDYKIAYVAEAKVIHSHNYTNRQQFVRNFDMAVSQAQHPEIFAQVKSESEGIRMVKETAIYLLKTRHPFKIIDLFFKSASKYMGYKLGLKYDKLPRWIVKKCTMNPRYWG